MKMQKNGANLQVERNGRLIAKTSVQKAPTFADLYFGSKTSLTLVCVSPSCDGDER